MSTGFCQCIPESFRNLNYQDGGKYKKTLACDGEKRYNEDDDCSEQGESEENGEEERREEECADIAYLTSLAAVCDVPAA